MRTVAGPRAPVVVPHKRQRQAPPLRPPNGPVVSMRGAGLGTTAVGGSFDLGGLERGLAVRGLLGPGLDIAGDNAARLDFDLAVFDGADDTGRCPHPEAFGGYQSAFETARYFGLLDLRGSLKIARRRNIQLAATFQVCFHRTLDHKLVAGGDLSIQGYFAAHHQGLSLDAVGPHLATRWGHAGDVADAAGGRRAGFGRQGLAQV